ncbi:MAG: AI-2E family transporter [Bacilli bacterium]
MKNQKLFRTALYIGITLLTLCTIYVFVQLSPVYEPVLTLINSIIFPFGLALFISFLLVPLVRGLMRFNIPKLVSILIIYSFFIILIVYGLYKGIPLIIDQIIDLNNYLPQFFDTYSTFIKQMNIELGNLSSGLEGNFQEYLTKVEAGLNALLASTFSFVKTLLNSVLLLIVIPFIVFYFLKDTDELIDGFYSLVPVKVRNITRSFMSELGESLGNYVRGQLYVATCIGLAATLLFKIIGLKYSLLMGIAVGVTNIIPYFGPVLGAIPAVIIAITMNFKMVLLVVIVVFCLQFVEGNILSPVIVGKKVSIHPVLIIFALLAGSSFGGIAGMLLAVPALVVLRVIVDHIRKYTNWI